MKIRINKDTPEVGVNNDNLEGVVNDDTPNEGFVNGITRKEMADKDSVKQFDDKEVGKEAQSHWMRRKSQRLLTDQLKLRKSQIC